ncbi:nicastrin-like [Cyprinus carpio]|uniref:Nicastrin-like n=1 Tax=Cyprinus carpio TaxID=7962 RepID=A0A9Q9XZW8_CYPCA|nr:nicastrin-like [Cyprinus carpio]
MAKDSAAQDEFGQVFQPRRGGSLARGGLMAPLRNHSSRWLWGGSSGRDHFKPKSSTAFEENTDKFGVSPLSFTCSSSSLPANKIRSLAAAEGRRSGCVKRRGIPLGGESEELAAPRADADRTNESVVIGRPRGIGLHRVGRASGCHSDPRNPRQATTGGNDALSLSLSLSLSQVSEMMNRMESAAAGLSVSVGHPSFSQPLPPSSLQRFLRAGPIPGLVLADHQKSFSNRYYESMYDDAENLNVTYPPGLTPDEQLVYETDAAKSLAEVATLVARSLYLQAGGENNSLSNITADPKTVSHMTNTHTRSHFPVLLSALHRVSSPRIHGPVHSVTRFVQYILANLTGTVTNLTESLCCQNPSCVGVSAKNLFSYFWVSGPASVNSTREPFCVRASVRLSKAVSPAFELLEYGSRNYSTWTESRWKSIRARIFLVASRELEMLTLGVGVAVLLLSLLVTYFISSKAELLFSSARDTPTTAY